MALEQAVGCREGAELAVAGAGAGVEANMRVDLCLAVAEFGRERAASLLDGKCLGRKVLDGEQGDDLIAVEQIAIKSLVDDMGDLGVQ